MDFSNDVDSGGPKGMNHQMMALRHHFKNRKQKLQKYESTDDFSRQKQYFGLVAQSSLSAILSKTHGGEVHEKPSKPFASHCRRRTKAANGIWFVEEK